MRNMKIRELQLEDPLQDDSNYKEELLNADLRDAPTPAMTIYSEKYYSDLLNSLNFSDHDDDVADHSARKGSTPEDLRSPFLYMKGGVRTMRLMKTLRSKVENVLPDQNQKKKGEIEREIQRAAYMCEKEAKEKIKARHVNVLQVALDNASRQVRFSLRERLIEKELLAPYRHNDDLTATLMRKFDQTNEERRERVKSARGSRPKSAHQGLNLQERIHQVKEKREILIAQQAFTRELNNQEKEERSNRALELASRSISENRVMKWLVTITALVKLRAMHKIVDEVREAKKRDIKSWRASRMIQKAWRRYSKPVVQVSLAEKMKVAMGGKENQDVFSQRMEAGDLICKFLNRHYVAGKVWIYLRKVRKAQGFFRRHRQVNSARIILLSNYMQECLTVLTMQIHLVLSNKGLDLRTSMTSFEINNMRNAINTITSTIYNQRPKLSSNNINAATNPFLIGNLLSSFFTAEFHGYMRTKMKQLHTFQKEFLQDVNIPASQFHHVPFSTIEHQYRRLWLDHPFLKRKMLLAFLVQKRWAFIESLHVREPLQIFVPTVSQNEANEFIKGGEDPLLHHLVSINEQIQTWQEKQSQPMYPFRRPKLIVIDSENPDKSEIDQYQKDWVFPMLLLLQSINATDVFTFFLQLGELILTFIAQEREKRLKMEQFGLLNVHRRLSVAMTVANHDSAELRSEQRRNSKASSRPGSRKASKDKVTVKKLNSDDDYTGGDSTQTSREGSRRNSKSNTLYPVPPTDRQQRSSFSNRKSIHKLTSTV